jgi:hypothetical protein
VRNTPGQLPEDLSKTTDGHLFVEVPAEGSAQFKLLAKKDRVILRSALAVNSG